MKTAREKGITKKPGRPATGRDPVYAVRLPKELMDEADAWAKARHVTRSWAIRRWIENGVMERWRPPKGRFPVK